MQSQCWKTPVRLRLALRSGGPGAGHLDRQQVVGAGRQRGGDLEGVGKEISLGVAQVLAVQPDVALVENAVEGQEPAPAGRRPVASGTAGGRGWARRSRRTPDATASGRERRPFARTTRRGRRRRTPAEDPRSTPRPASRHPGPSGRRVVGEAGRLPVPARPAWFRAPPVRDVRRPGVACRHDVTPGDHWTAATLRLGVPPGQGGGPPQRGPAHRRREAHRRGGARLRGHASCRSWRTPFSPATTSSSWASAGQAKTRMIRSLTGLLDEWLPYIAGSEILRRPVPAGLPSRP